MTRPEMIQLVMATAEETEDVVSSYLTLAEGIVRVRAYPFGDGTETIPAAYHTIVCQVATYLISKRGAEGEITHSENNTSRTYESGDVPASLLRHITPYCGVLI